MGKRYSCPPGTCSMARTVELSEQLRERLKTHTAEDETIEAFLEELLSIYEQEERFTDSGL